jgi:hypothetical protein
LTKNLVPVKDPQRTGLHIVGGALAALAFVSMCCCLIIFACRRRNKKKKEKELF